jgi:hypothetical protein
VSHRNKNISFSTQIIETLLSTSILKQGGCLNRPFGALVTELGRWTCVARGTTGKYTIVWSQLHTAETHNQ